MSQAFGVPRYPGYGFARHQGYPVRAHYAALEKLGPCPVHRRSFLLVRKRAPESDSADQRDGV